MKIITDCFVFVLVFVIVLVIVLVIVIVNVNAAYCFVPFYVLPFGVV